MSFRIRPSKFRHVYGEPAKKLLCYENIRISKNAHDTYFSCANPKFLAVIIECAGGGAFQVLPLEKTGRIDLDWGKVSGHSAPVLDIKFDPFNDNVIASASEDCTVKLWHIPDGGAREIRDSLVTLQGHQRRVVQIEWHPTAEHILLSAGNDSWVIVWDVGRGEAIRVIDCHTDVVCSLSFSLTGNLFATTCRDLQIRLIEPRMAKVAQMTPGHAGSKASKLAFLTNRKKLFTTGFSKYVDRQYAVWDINNLSQPLKMDILDSSSGVAFPYYDADCSVVYLAGRGDGNIRYYEMVDSFPIMHYLSQFQSSAPQRSLCFMPKRGLDVKSCEIFRFYKLYATKNYIEPISMIAPRKSGLFHEDLFPDTAAPTPSMTTEEWLNGENLAPVLISLKARDSLKTNKPVHYRTDDNQLITSDRNNEMKFRFIADSAVSVDYRPLSERKNKTLFEEGSVNGTTDTRIFSNSEKRRSLALASDSQNSSHISASNGFNRQSGSDRWTGRQHRYSLQEEPASSKSDQTDAEDRDSTVVPSRTFKKLQRIWSDRQHSLDVMLPDSPTVDGNGETTTTFCTLHETPEHEEQEEHKKQEGPQPLSDLSELSGSSDLSALSVESDLSDGSSVVEKQTNGTVSSDSQTTGNGSDERNDKENNDPDPSFPQMCKLFLEQKEKIVQLERAFRLKEEENFRLLAEIKYLKEQLLNVLPNEVNVDATNVFFSEKNQNGKLNKNFSERGTSES